MLAVFVIVELAMFAIFVIAMYKVLIILHPLILVELQHGVSRNIMLEVVVLLMFFRGGSLVSNVEYGEVVMRVNDLEVALSVGILDLDKCPVILVFYDLLHVGGTDWLLDTFWGFELGGSRGTRLTGAADIASPIFGILSLT